MNKTEVKDAVLDIIGDLVDDEDLTKIDETVRLRDQLDLDSMDFLDIIMELRKRYSIQVPEEDYPKFATLEGSVTYLEPLLLDK
jgi:acyl carrier protein